jgi:Rieske 2Fe-2S family protein
MALLERSVASLPATWYCDPAQYARELEAVWYRCWVCIGRVEDLREPGDHLTVGLGDERLVVTRDREGSTHAIRDGCRVAIEAWGGFLFVNLEERPATSFGEFLGEEARKVLGWPLAGLTSVHRESSSLECNWKVFWENYSECYHCPGIHPELCRVMPLYRQGLLDYGDSKKPSPVAGDTRPRVAPGFTTWTLDGQTTLPLIEGPNEDDRAAGVVFASFTASLFIVAHPDYVRSVRILPRGPERIELTVDWLLPPGVADRHAEALEKMYALGRLVVAQDGRVCELNQQGLRSRHFQAGVLMPQEASLHEFHEWLRARLEAVA